MTGSSAQILSRSVHVAIEALNKVIAIIVGRRIKGQKGRDDPGDPGGQPHSASFDVWPPGSPLIVDEEQLLVVGLVGISIRS